MRIKLGIRLKISEIAKAIGGHFEKDGEILYLSTDSRELEAGDLFVPLKGNNFNGEDYVSEAIEFGAIPMCQGHTNFGIQVTCPEKALLLLAHYYKSRLKNLKYTVGITGSVGKTTTKEFISVIARMRYKTHSSKGNMNNKIGLPLTILSAPYDTEFLVLEMGMNHSGEIDLLSRVAEPNIAVITKVGTSHIGNLGSRENIAKAKLEIKNGIKNGMLILPYAEPLLASKSNAVYFSTASFDAKYCLINTPSGAIKLYLNKQEICAINFHYNEPHILECLVAAISVSFECGICINEIIKGISYISKDNLRQSILSVNKLYLYDDCYNASLESVIADINVVKGLNGYSRKSILLGDIYELGDYNEAIHKEIGKHISPLDFHNLYLLGDLVKHVKAGAENIGFPDERIYCYSAEDYLQCAKQMVSDSIAGEIILIKGSRAMRLERIIELIKEISRE